MDGRNMRRPWGGYDPTAAECCPLSAGPVVGRSDRNRQACDLLSRGVAAAASGGPVPGHPVTVKELLAEGALLSEQLDDADFGLVSP